MAGGMGWRVAANLGKADFRVGLSGTDTTMKRAMLAIAALMLAAPAFAAPPPKVTFNADGSYTVSDAFDDEMYCAADTAGDLTMELLSEGVVENIDDDDTAESLKLLQEASATCAKKFGWTDKQRTWAEILAQYEAIEFYAEQMFAPNDLTLEEVENIWASLTIEDRIAFLTANSMDDAGRKQRVETALKAAGVKDDEEHLYYGKVAMVAISFIYYARDSWAESLKP